MKSLNARISLAVAALLVAGVITGCQSAYYGAMEDLGYHKRDILVSRVKKARDTQSEAKEQFVTALESFKAVVDFEGGELESKYKTLKKELDRSESKAEAVRKKVKDVEKVSTALFKEWRVELEKYNSGTLRASSERKLRDTEARYDQLIRAMKRAESKLEPALVPFRDQVLYLKHNLNARAISSLRGELGAVESDVASLIKEIETSVGEADQFISSMKDE
jgi:predicted  nucleic acid-binding Zn-ribbon protein